MYVTRVLTDELTIDAVDPKVKGSRDGVKGVCVGDSGGGDVGVVDMTGESESESDEHSLRSIRKNSHSSSSSNNNGNSDSNSIDNNHRNDRDTKIKDENININIDINDTTTSGKCNSNNSNSISGVKDESSPTNDDNTVQNLGTKIPAKRTLDLNLESEQLDRKKARSHALIHSAEWRKKLSLTHAIHPVSFYGHFIIIIILYFICYLLCICTNFIQLYF